MDDPSDEPPEQSVAVLRVGAVGVGCLALYGVAFLRDRRWLHFVGPLEYCPPEVFQTTAEVVGLVGLSLLSLAAVVWAAACDESTARILDRLDIYTKTAAFAGLLAYAAAFHPRQYIVCDRLVGTPAWGVLREPFIWARYGFISSFALASVSQYRVGGSNWWRVLRFGPPVAFFVSLALWGAPPGEAPVDYFRLPPEPQ